MQFRVSILGSNSAIPAYGRHPTAQILSYNHHNYLIDCGEGTQMQFQRYAIKRAKLNHAFISHLHGDHYFGFIGLITSLSLNGRSQPFHVFGPEGLKEIVQLQLRLGHTELKFELHFHIVDPNTSELIFENDHLMVESISLEHRIGCTGFLFKEKSRDLNIIPEKIQEFNIPIPAIQKIKKGEDFITSDGNTILNAELTKAPPPVRSYAYVTDTLYKEDILPQIKNVDLLYHEATFDDRLIERAAITFHCTARQAAQIAKKANAKKLIIGHFSSRYESLDILLEEAKSVFSDSSLALEGSFFDV